MFNLYNIDVSLHKKSSFDKSIDEFVKFTPIKSYLKSID